jgi:hypothetical protein
MSKLDKKEISKMIKDKDSLPMYDIINNTIILIPESKIYYNFNKNYLRILDNSILRKLNIKISINEKEIKNRFYTKIFEQHPKLGKEITFCEKKSFLYFINYNNNPYYTSSELQKKNIFFNINLKDNKKICDKLQGIELSKKDLQNSYDFLVKSKYDKIVKYYTFVGASNINEYLRENIEYVDSIDKSIILKLDNAIKESPKINKDIVVFRFLSDDTFLNLEMKNKVFIEKGFMSTTRNPMMKHAQLNFGNIIMRIFISKKYSNNYLSVESLSLFPDEQEIILDRGSKLKLKKIHSIDNIKIYDFDYIGISKKIDLNTNDNINIIDLKYFTNNQNLNSLYNDWNSYYNLINLKIDDKEYLFKFGYLEDDPVLNKFYHFDNNILYMYLLSEEGDIDLFIEITNDSIFINNFFKYFGYKNNTSINDYMKIYKKLIGMLSLSFNIDNVFINSMQISGYLLKKETYSNNQICIDYYNYLMNTKKILPSYLKNTFSVYYLNYLIKKKIDKNILYEFPSLKLFCENNEITTLKILFIKIVELHPSLMIDFYHMITYYFDTFNNPFSNDYFILNIKKMLFI